MHSNSGTRLANVIPGGSHTYSRGADQFPSNAPSLTVRGRGAYIWGDDGNRYLDYGMALRSVTLGYANRAVNRSAFKAMALGNNLTRPSEVELQAAEFILGRLPGMDMIKFAKNGSNAVTAAVKLARAYTGRKMIAVAREHPFFSFDDWFIGTTPMSRGVPEETSAMTLKFSFNDIESLESLFTKYPGQIAAVLLEPATSQLQPMTVHASHEASATGPCGCPNFLQQVRELTVRQEALLILDEMITGYRWDKPGASHMYQVEPDLMTFGKSIANGFSVAFVAGKREVMQIAGITEKGAERVFLLSSTHGAEMGPLAAMMKSIELIEKRDVTAHLRDFGTALQTGFNERAQSHNLSHHLKMVGFPASPTILFFGEDGLDSPLIRTLFAQEMCKAGVLMPWVALSASHQERELKFTLQSVSKVFGGIRFALEQGAERFLEGPPIAPVFRRFN